MVVETGADHAEPEAEEKMEFYIICCWNWKIIILKTKIRFFYKMYMSCKTPIAFINHKSPI